MHILDRQPNNELQWVWDPVQSFRHVQLLIYRPLMTGEHAHINSTEFEYREHCKLDT